MAKKPRKTEVVLPPEESRELEMIVDRLSVQDPEGQSLTSYLQSLRSALSGREELASALLEKLSKNPSEVGFRAFLSLDDLIQTKEHRRIAKQAGYRFAQRGYTVDSGKASAERVVLIPKETRRGVAHLIPAEEVTWFISVFLPDEDNFGPTAISAFAEDRFQQISVRVVESSQRLYKEYIQKLARHFPDKPCEIPVWHAAGLYFEMLKFHGDKEIPAEARRAKQLLKSFHDPEKLPYAYQLMPELQHPEEHLGEVDVRALLEQLDAAGLFLGKDDLLPYAKKIEELERPVLVVPQEMQQQRIMDVMQKAADDLCAGATRFLYQRFFEEQALWLKLSAKNDLAMSAWIIAQHLRGKARSSENPLAVQLVMLSVQTHWPESSEPEAPDPSGFTQTESGLILLR